MSCVQGMGQSVESHTEFSQLVEGLEPGGLQILLEGTSRGHAVLWRRLLPTQVSTEAGKLHAEELSSLTENVHIINPRLLQCPAKTWIPTLWAGSYTTREPLNSPHSRFSSGISSEEDKCISRCKSGEMCQRSTFLLWRRFFPKCKHNETDEKRH